MPDLSCIRWLDPSMFEGSEPNNLERTPWTSGPSCMSYDELPF